MKNLSWKESLCASPGPHYKKDYFLLYVKGLAMGVADLIPGVSGGTIAFITGIYENLLAAITSFKKDVLYDLLKFNCKIAVSKIHTRFILTLILGIGTAVFSFSHLMHYLMNTYPIPTWAAFFGLIGASSIVIFRQLKFKGMASLSFILLGAVFAYLLVGLVPIDTPTDFWFIYLCGIIAITAMILPGISGSFLLLILGKYEYITGALKSPFIGTNISTLFIFSAGMVTGLFTFSKVLHFLMTFYKDKTMAFLTGVLVGSLRKVWPWKEVLESKIIRGKYRVIQEVNIRPPSIDGEFFLALLLIILSLIVVFYLDNLSRRLKRGVSSTG